MKMMMNSNFSSFTHIYEANSGMLPKVLLVSTEKACEAYGSSYDACRAYAAIARFAKARSMGDSMYYRRKKPHVETGVDFSNPSDPRLCLVYEEDGEYRHIHTALNILRCTHAVVKGIQEGKLEGMSYRETSRL
jgi:hypothetical protein